MAENDQKQGTNPDDQQGKVGSDPEAAKAFGGKRDFGVPANKGRTRDRDYTSQNAKASDPGAAQPHSSEFTGVRTHGAGGMASGEGSSSGGDIDPDIIGLGDGGSGIAASPPGHRPGADDTDGSTNEMASGPPAAGENETDVGKIGGPSPVYRSMVQANPDLQNPPGNEGADAASNPDARDDDSFRGEVSASGESLSIEQEQEEQEENEESEETND